MSHHVIVGNSVAAHSAATRIVGIEPEAAITFISDESAPYYSRCALMYFVMDHCAEQDMYIADDEHYRRLNSQLVHDRVVSVDPQSKLVRLASGDDIAYDRLLLACGAGPRKLGVEGEDADGVYDFTTIAHARAVLEGIKRAKRAVVIGGGLIGSEVAEVMEANGIAVDYIIRESHFYPIFCSEPMGRIIEERFRKHHINIITGRGIGHLEKRPDGRVCAVVDDQGERHECDLVVRAIGVDPNIDFLDGSGIPCETGILVDHRMATGIEDIWAAGDCAEVRFPGEERTTIQKLWYTAQPQGWVAGANMAGEQAAYAKPPSYQAAMFVDLDFASYGEMPASWNELQEETLLAGNGIDCIRIVHDGEKVAGVSFLGRALTKEDIEHLVVGSTRLDEARQKVEGVFEDRYPCRAPAARLSEGRKLSRRPFLWPLGRRKTWRV